MKKSFLLIMMLLLALGSWAKDNIVVWNSPTAESSNVFGDGFFNIAIDITKVELSEAETKVYLSISERSDYPDIKFQFAQSTYLKADNGERYPIVSADGMPLGEWIQTGKDGKLNVVFHFKPAPLNTKVLDLTEGDFDGAFYIQGIKSVEERQKQFFPSYWRNEKTGDWEIAFLEDFMIYDGQFWYYKEKPDLTKPVTQTTFNIYNEKGWTDVKVGKDKKGKRTIQVGKNPAVLCSMLTDRFMSDYPNKDTREGFIDNNGRVDSVTLTGLIINRPDDMTSFKISTHDPYLDDQIDYTAKMYSAKNFSFSLPMDSVQLDKYGRFTITFPLTNSAEFFCDWNTCFIRTVFEPGKKYFMLYDLKEGRRYFMGEDVRLQNELFKYPLDWNRVRMERGQDADAYVEAVDENMKSMYRQIDELCALHPNLSTRFKTYRKGNTLVQQATSFGQARFSMPNFSFTEKARQYATENFWNKMEKPYTLHRDLYDFIYDYLDDAIISQGNRSISVNPLDYIDELTDNEDEIKLAKSWQKEVEAFNKKIEEEPTAEGKQKMADDFNTQHKDVIDTLNKILNSDKANKFVQDYFFKKEMEHTIHVLDSLGVDDQIRDAKLFKDVNEYMDHSRRSLSPETMESVKGWIKNPIYVEKLVNMNNTYLAIENRTFDKSILKSNDNVKDMTEGEQILRKIIEPYKGKTILLDIWGTWCAPCKEALSHSKEEYAALAPYDMVFLYLANNSDQTSWENIIKQYEVTGDNVVHYNLPAEQQEAIEQWLKVSSFPTYKLIDKEGNFLDVNADPRELEDFRGLMERMLK